MSLGRAISRDFSYYVFVGVLFAFSAFFTYRVETYRNMVANARLVGDIESGLGVSIVEVVDGDEVTVKGEDGKNFVVRLLGIKAFDPTAVEPGITGFGLAATAFLGHEFSGKPLKLVFDKFLKDKKGRVLAYLEYGDRDVGLELVRQGFVPVYTEYPFSRKERYLEVEREARAQKCGLWSSEKAVQRVSALKASWEAGK